MSFSERLTEIRTGFERPFWVANISELFERLSYYAVFAVLARYLHEDLHFDVERASSLIGMFGGWVWFLAVGGGALADRLGFDNIWEVEHHYLEEHSHSSRPEVLLAAASQRTSRMRLGHG